MNVLSRVVLQMGGGQMGPSQMGNGMGPGGWGFGWGFTGFAVMLLLLGAVVYVLARAFSDGGGMRSGGSGRMADSRATHDHGGRTGEDPAMVELRERYARGDIDDEEFERRTQRLRSDPGPAE